MAKPSSKNSPVVRARAWTSGTTNPLAIYAEVKRGDYPVLGAKVEVSINRPGLNGSAAYREKFDLLDTGNGGQYSLSTKNNAVETVKITILNHLKCFFFFF